MRCRSLLPALLFVSLLVPSASGQLLDKSVLNSTVWVTYQSEATPAEPASANSPAKRAVPASEFGGTGFLVFHGVGYTKGQVYLITNKHVLPPEGKQADIRVRVAIREKDGSVRVDSVSVPVVGADGKYLDSVRVHPDPDTDVGAVNIAPAAFKAKFDLLINAITTRKYLDMSIAGDPSLADMSPAEQRAAREMKKALRKNEPSYQRVQNQCETEISKAEYRCAMKAPSPETWQACID